MPLTTRRPGSVQGRSTTVAGTTRATTSPADETGTGRPLTFPISYIFGDVLTEVYGYARSRQVIWAGLLCNVLMAGFLWIVVQLPPAQGWPLQEQFATVLYLVPRVVVASTIGYWAGEFANSFLLAKLKVFTSGRFLWIRTISSTVVGQGVDTVLFVLIAFADVFPQDLLVRAIWSGVPVQGGLRSGRHAHHLRRRPVPEACGGHRRV